MSAHEKLQHPVYGLMAEFDSAQDLIEAANRTREAGYKKIDAYSPFPIEGMAEAIGFHKNQASDEYITDTAAGATALACGEKTYNGAISVDQNKKTLTTILEIAESHGLASGLVATCSITHAKPACFISSGSCSRIAPAARSASRTWSRPPVPALL